MEPDLIRKRRPPETLTTEEVKDLQKRSRKLLKWVLVSLFLIVAGGFYYWNFLAPTVVDAKMTDVAIMASQFGVSSQFGDEAKLYFSALEETHVEALSPERYRVKGWVDHMLDSGEHVLMEYTAIIQYQQDEWICERVEFFPQS